MYSVSGGGGGLARATHSEVDSPDRVLEMCTEKGIAFMPFFPLSIGAHAKPSGALDAVAKRHGASPAQVAVAWLLARSPVMLPIPGTSSVAHLEENLAAARLQLTAAELTQLG